jgi:hypothetical protein
MMTAINRWYSYPTVAAIRIDIHPAGENLINTLPTLDPCMVPDHTSHVVHVGNFSVVPTRMKQAPTPERSLGNQRQTGPAIVLGHLIPLPHDSLGVGERGFDQVIT